ncbi:hypothetical protein D0A37_23835 [Microcoleus vaginatus HSN003]|nr:hypothetical protein D0A37_23835 [Microcoleus vaginatus HSN003]
MIFSYFDSQDISPTIPYSLVGCIKMLILFIFIQLKYLQREIVALVLGKSSILLKRKKFRA